MERFSGAWTTCAFPGAATDGCAETRIGCRCERIQAGRVRVWDRRNPIREHMACLVMACGISLHICLCSSSDTIYFCAVLAVFVLARTAIELDTLVVGTLE